MWKKILQIKPDANKACGCSDNDNISKFKKPCCFKEHVSILFDWYHLFMFVCSAWQNFFGGLIEFRFYNFGLEPSLRIDFHHALIIDLLWKVSNKHFLFNTFIIIIWKNGVIIIFLSKVVGLFTLFLTTIICCKELAVEVLFKKPVSITTQKMKISIKDLFSKCDQICRKLRIWSHLPRKSLMENFSFSS